MQDFFEIKNTEGVATFIDKTLQIWFIEPLADEHQVCARLTVTDGKLFSKLVISQDSESIRHQIREQQPEPPQQNP